MTGWLADVPAATEGGFQADGDLNGKFSEMNVSKHDRAGATGDDGCRICHEIGHFARDCPEKKEKQSGCFNCGQEGHMKSDCTAERKMECHHCGGDHKKMDCPDAPKMECHRCGGDHKKVDCPEQPVMKCRVCGEPHKAVECTVNRLLLNVKVDGLQTADDAWKLLQEASDNKDLDDFNDSFFKYAKLSPAMTLAEMEETMRSLNMPYYLIAKEQELSGVFTLANLQGKTGQKYFVTFQTSPKAQRAKFAAGWPSDPEENMVRLSEAGFPIDSLIPKCQKCGEMGHTKKFCKEDEADKVPADEKFGDEAAGGDNMW